jgi:hypothetical protein
LKALTQSTFLGQQGINLVERRVQSMGYWWYPTAVPEAGIDGHLEIRDSQTGGMTNLIVQVQSKATEGAWIRESSNSFEYVCKEEDLQYWLMGNAPVIIVFGRPKTDEAYWISVKDYFQAHPECREPRKINVDKETCRFDKSAADAIFRLARPKEAGIYLSPRPKNEKLYSNLLRVSSYAEHVFVAQTDIRDFRDIWDGARELDIEIGCEWVLSDGNLMSFHDLSTYPWTEFCDSGTMETFETSEWADSEGEDRQRQFVRLLNHALRERLKQWSVRRRKEDKAYFFALGKDQRSRRVDFLGSVSDQFRTVVKKYPLGRTHYFRHLAFYGYFKRLDGEWYLEIAPSYVFTTNGYRTSRYEPDLLSGIKIKERNDAVIVQVHLWTDVLTRTADLVHVDYPFLRFSELLTFSLPYGIDDREWLAHEELDTGADGIQALTNLLPFFQE